MVGKILLIQFWVISISLAVSLSAPVSVYALSQNQRKVIQSGIPYFNVEDNFQKDCAPTANLTGSEITEKVFNYFLTKGLTAPQAAGIMGNLQEESGINPRRVQDKPGQPRSPDSDVITLDGKTGFGLVQWTSLGRQQGLRVASQAAGTKDSDLTVQLEYLWKEMGTSEFKDNGFERLKASQDVREITSIFMLSFERPEVKTQAAQDRRAALSLAWLAKYGSSVADPTAVNSGPTVVTDFCGGSGLATVTSGFSLPVTDDFYEDNRQAFLEDHHLRKNGSQFPAADIPMDENTLIYTMSDGVVEKAPAETIDKGYGLGVIINAGNGIKFIYGHGTDGGAFPGAKQGDTVKAGQPIMHSGNTGKSTGPHLHLEIRVGSQLKCPQSFFESIYNKKVLPVESLPNEGCSSGDRI